MAEPTSPSRPSPASNIIAGASGGFVSFALMLLVAFLGGDTPATPQPLPSSPTPVIVAPVDPTPEPTPKPSGKIIAQVVYDSKGIALDPDSTVCTAIRAVSEQPQDAYVVMTIRAGAKQESVVVTVGQGSPTPVVSPKPELPPAPTPTTKATAATYVYDVRSSSIPPAVLAGLNRLNREKKILATLYEDNANSGSGEVPAQYKLAYEAAKAAGLPPLIVTDGKSVLKVVKDPKTVEQIMESIEQ